MIKTHLFKQPISYHYDIYTPSNNDIDGQNPIILSSEDTKLGRDNHQENQSLHPLKGPPLLICQHGYGQNKTMAMRFGQNIRRDWTIIAQQGPHKHHKIKDGKFDTGFSWVSGFDSQEDIDNHHDFILHCLEEAVDKGWAGQQKAYLFGFSQSVSLLFRFAAKFPENVAGVIAVAGAAPTDWVMEGKTKLPIPVLYICPIEDQSYDYERMMYFKKVLRYHCNELEWLELPGGHRVPSASYLPMKEWLDKQERQL